MADLAAWRTWWIKRRWYERNRRLRRRLRIHRHAAQGGFYIRMPVEGEVLEALDSGRLVVGEGTLFEPGCWLTLGPEARITIGQGCFLNRETMLAALERIEIGDRAVIGANSVVTKDIPGGTIAAGAPAKVIREIDFHPTRRSPKDEAESRRC